jgi:hypothetical protein
MDGVTSSKSSFVVTDIPKFIAAIDAGTVELKVEAHRTRASREIFYLNATIGGVSNKLYFSLPINQSFDRLDDETPKLILKIPVDKDGIAVSSDMAKFEEEYRLLMSSKVEPLLKASAKIDETKTMHLANFGKSESATTKFVLCQLPRTIKSDQITRLQEARGSHVLLSVAYIYTLVDAEKGKVVYGSIFEVGRFPFTERSAELPPRAPKRKAPEIGTEELPEAKKLDKTLTTDSSVESTAV